MMRAMLPALLFITIACTSAPVGQRVMCDELDATTPVYEAGGNITAPRVKYRVEAVPPRGLAGGPREATVEAEIGADGIVRAVCIRSGNPQWAAVLQDAVRQWQFEPATMDGKPVPVRFVVTATMR